MALAFPSDWTRFPAAWFGANATHFEDGAQIQSIGRYSLAIFGWQHLIFMTNWTAAIYAQLNQAAILKARIPTLPVYVYTGFGNANGYNAATWEIISSASRGCPGHQPCRKVAKPYTDWVLETDSVPVYSMAACEQMGLGYTNPPTERCWNPIWNVANASMRNFFVERIVRPLAATPFVDGIFFDCFDQSYTLPSPWGRHARNIENCSAAGGAGCEALVEGAIDLARRVTLALNAEGKAPMFSNVGTFTRPKRPSSPWLDEARLLTALKGMQFQFNYERVRAEALASSGQLANMLEESRRRVPVGFHVYLRDKHEDPAPHVAAFLLLRQAGWYFFASTGWLDKDWHYSTFYDTVAVCGRPREEPRGDPAPLRYARTYEGCSVLLDCTNTSKDGCVASITI